jgi:hypothetical protein
MSDGCLPDNAVRSDNSDRCIAVSIRRKEWPRTSSETHITSYTMRPKESKLFWRRITLYMTDENDSDEILTDHRLRSCQRQQVAIRMLHNVFTICLLQD